MELHSSCGEVPWSIVDASRRVLASLRATIHTVSVLNVCFFLHACEAVYGVSKCKFCENLRLKTLSTRLESCHAPEAAEALRESVTWGLDVELKEMESEQMGLALSLSLSLSPEPACEDSPVEFTHDYLCPSPRARNAISFGLEDILFTAAAESEDFGPASADALPPSGQEARPSAAYPELVDVLARTT